VALQTSGVGIGRMHSYRDVKGTRIVFEKVLYSFSLSLDVTEEAIGRVTCVALIVRTPAMTIVQCCQSLTARVLHVLDKMPHGEVTGFAKLHLLRVLQANNVSHRDDKQGEKYKRADGKPLQGAFRQTPLDNEKYEHQQGADHRRANRKTLEPDEDGIDVVREGGHGLHLRKETEKRRQLSDHGSTFVLFDSAKELRGAAELPTKAIGILSWIGGAREFQASRDS